jgi:hypothetical protein
LTVRPGAPSYLDIPYSAADLANGAAKPPTPPVPPEPDRNGSPKTLGKRALISDIAEERPIPADAEDALFQAADKAYRIAAGRIKFHEAQLRRWRAVAASFAGLSSGEGPAAAVPNDVAAQFLELMGNLPEGTS